MVDYIETGSHFQATRKIVPIGRLQRSQFSLPDYTKQFSLVHYKNCSHLQTVQKLFLVGTLHRQWFSPIDYTETDSDWKTKQKLLLTGRLYRDSFLLKLQPSFPFEMTPFITLLCFLVSVTVHSSTAEFLYRVVGSSLYVMKEEDMEGPANCPVQHISGNSMQSQDNLSTMSSVRPEVEVQRHLFATSTPNIDESSTSPSGRFTVREKRPLPIGQQAGWAFRAEWAN